MNFYYCLMSSSIRHRFLGLFSTKSILSASLSSSGSLQSPSFSPSPSPSSSCFLLAVASSAACRLRHFVLRFWNQTWQWKEIEKLLKINHKKSRCVFSLNHKTNRLIGRLFEMVYLAFFIATSYGVERESGEGRFKKGRFKRFMGVFFAFFIHNCTNVYH